MQPEESDDFTKDFVKVTGDTIEGMEVVADLDDGAAGWYYKACMYI